MPVELHQFAFSHYNEIARWALDWKGIEHQRIDYLPGPHIPAMQRLSGQRQTPVLVWNGEVIAGSGAILDALESRAPQPTLQPATSPERQQVAELRRYFETEAGPAVRTVLFSELIHHGDYVCRMFAVHKSSAKQRAYRLAFPLIRGAMARANGAVDPANVARSFEVVDAALDRVAQLAGPDSQLVGQAFTAADLTAAALLAPLVGLEHPDMARPQPPPASVAGLLERWSSHPGVVWVRHQYDRFRK